MILRSVLVLSLLVPLASARALMAQTAQADGQSADPETQRFDIRALIAAAEKQAQTVDPTQEASTPDKESSRRLRSWELPEVEVVGEAPAELSQERRVGSYGQPRWTAHRRFPTTRVYVIPDGMIEVEYWLRSKTSRDGQTEFEHRQEVELGLGHRLQLDLYLIEKHDDTDLHFDQSIELRYAFADWGKLPGNPTAYVEYIFQEDRADKLEVKLLLGGELAPRWHWGTNLVWEQDLGDAQETVLELTEGLSYSITDEFGVGLEGKFEIANEKGARSTWGENVRLGPSFQWRPTKRLHFDLAPLFGLTEHSSLADVFLVMGWEF